MPRWNQSPDMPELIPLEDIPTETISVEGCRRLWCEVISHQWKGALPEVYRWCRGRRLSGNQLVDVKRCQDWFGTTDYFSICELAGVDGTAILNEFKRCMGDIGNYRGVKDARS